MNGARRMCETAGDSQFSCQIALIMKPYYDHEGITIYHGDCREVISSLDPVSCIVTSPPYNQLGSRIPERGTGMWGRSHGGSGFVKEVNANGYADDLDED